MGRRDQLLRRGQGELTTADHGHMGIPIPQAQERGVGKLAPALGESWEPCSCSPSPSNAPWREAKSPRNLAHSTSCWRPQERGCQPGSGPAESPFPSLTHTVLEPPSCTHGQRACWNRATRQHLPETCVHASQPTILAVPGPESFAGGPRGQCKQPCLASHWGECEGWACFPGPRPQT